MRALSGRKKTTTAGRSVEAIIAVALLLAALAAPSTTTTVQASTRKHSSCVQITSATIISSSSSSCMSGANIESFAFSMEGVAGGAAAAYDVVKTDTGLKLNGATLPAAARAGEPVVPCPATGVIVAVGFAAPVISVANPSAATVSGASMVTFFAEDIESNSTEFAVVLDTTGVAAETNVVIYVSYSDNEGNFPDMSGLMTMASAAELECDEYTTADVRRRLRAGNKYDCDVCSILSSAQLEALDMYDNGGKQVVCDLTCLDGVSDPTHCNYFGLGQICRGCGDCSTCSPCPTVTDETPSPTPNLIEASTSVPTPAGTPFSTQEPVVDSKNPPPKTKVVSSDDDDGASEFDCSPCTELSDDQVEALAMYDRGGKRIVCDPTCLDGVSDPIHCNYFGLGQICRGCGKCETCTPCP